MQITADRRDSPFGSALMTATRKTPMKKPTTKAKPQPEPPAKARIGGKPRGRPRKNPA
jgi:hypothetical protein